MAGDVLSFGDASIHALWPAPDPPSDRPAPDDDSLVMRVSARGMNFLLPGDAGIKAEKGMLTSSEPLESQVLKVGHHGAKSYARADFLARVAPRVAIISTEGGGEGARVLPNPETLLALENAGAKVFRSDTDGAITVDWKGGALTVRTYLGVESIISPGVAR